MLRLYHYGGAICAQKVRLALEEKQVRWESKECVGDTLRDPEYLRLNPNGVVPTLVHNETVLTESRIISEYIDDAFQGPMLMPESPAGRHRVRLWSKQIDDSLHINVFILTFASVGRNKYLAMAPDVRAKQMPGLQDAIKRRMATELLEDGLHSPWVQRAFKRFQRLVAEMDRQLSQSRFLAGDLYSLADADYTAYVNRLTNLGLSSLWSEKPALADWYLRMKARLSFDFAISEWETSQELNLYQQQSSQIREVLDPIMLHG